MTAVHLMEGRGVDTSSLKGKLLFLLYYPIPVMFIKGQ